MQNGTINSKVTKLQLQKCTENCNQIGWIDPNVQTLTSLLSLGTLIVHTRHFRQGKHRLKIRKSVTEISRRRGVHNTTCQYGDLVRYRPRVYASHNALRAIPQAHARDSRPRAGIGPSSARFGLQHWRRTPGGQHWRPSGRVPYAIRRYCRYEPLCCQHWANCAMFAG